MRLCQTPKPSLFGTLSPAPTHSCTRSINSWVSPAVEKARIEIVPIVFASKETPTNYHKSKQSRDEICGGILFAILHERLSNSLTGKYKNLANFGILTFELCTGEKNVKISAVKPILLGSNSTPTLILKIYNLVGRDKSQICLQLFTNDFETILWWTQKLANFGISTFALKPRIVYCWARRTKKI